MDNLMNCDDCGGDTGDLCESYMLRNEVWMSAHHDGILCVGCVEVRLGRTLKPDDFIDAPINKGAFEMSPRLLSRVGLTQEDARRGCESFWLVAGRVSPT